ncbi:MAG: holo-ACP synthase [Acidobacteria bacterium]|nr:holo-ACP synthase [Acidobacteriota bacterium]
MIIAIGIDIIEISRLEEKLSRHNMRLRDRVFTPAEIAYCESRASKYASYAARFAAKEAAMKALGTGWAEGIGWQEIEVCNNEVGAPSLQLSGHALERFHQVGASRAHLSLSHSRDLAIAQVIFEQ